MMVLIDSSSWIESLRVSGKPEVRARVHALLTAGQAAWCDMVRLEIWNGARGSQERTAIGHLGSTIQLLKTDDHVWKLAVELAKISRDAGYTASASDLVIVACARHHGVPLEHCDPHLVKLQALWP